MVRNYVRKTKRQSWSSDSMRQAIEACESGTMGYGTAALQFDVPKSTLRDRVKQKTKLVTEHDKGFVGGFQKVFTDQEEEELVQYTLKMEELLVGLTRDDICSFAFQLATKYNKPNPFSSEKAGFGWYYTFMKKHPQLSLQTPEATSAARARGFNEVSVAACFNLLGEMFEKHNFSASNIYNVDETGITTVQGAPSKIIETSWVSHVS